MASSPRSLPPVMVHLARILLIVALGQLLFWVLIAGGEVAARPGGMSTRPFVDFTLLDDAGRPIEGGRRFRAHYTPEPIYREVIADRPARAVFEIPFEAEPGSADLAFYIGASRSLQEVRLNGQVIQPNVPLDRFSGTAGWDPVFYMLPDASLQRGQNLVTVLIENEGYVHAFGRFAIGPAEQLATAFANGKVLNVDLPLAAIAILLFATLLHAAVNWPAADKGRVRALIALMLLWAARTYLLTFSPPLELSRTATIVLYTSVLTGVVFAAGRFVLAETGAGTRMRGFHAAAWLVMQLLCLLAPLLEGHVGTDSRAWFALWMQVIAAVTVLNCGAAVLVLAVATRLRPITLLVERLVLMLCLTALAVDTIDEATPLHVPFQPESPLTFYTFSLMGLLLGLSVVISLARQATEARDTVVRSNERLSEKLAEREAELSSGYRTQSELLQRQAVLEERQRIMRDMHDGIGGRLLGLSLQARAPLPDTAALAEGLDASLTDLRLIVDCMDTAERGLAESMAAFTHRAQAQVEAAGMTFTADVQLASISLSPGSRQTLQLLRLLQEALTNALRHSRASRIGLAARAAEDGSVEVSICDDGLGLQGRGEAGNGLRNMSVRAKAMGATLGISDLAPGTRVTVVLPTHRTPDPAAACPDSGCHAGPGPA